MTNMLLSVPLATTTRAPVPGAQDAAGRRLIALRNDVTITRVQLDLLEHWGWLSMADADGTVQDAALLKLHGLWPEDVRA